MASSSDWKLIDNRRTRDKSCIMEVPWTSYFDNDELRLTFFRVYRKNKSDPIETMTLSLSEREADMIVAVVQRQRQRIEEQTQRRLQARKEATDEQN